MRFNPKTFIEDFNARIATGWAAIDWLIEGYAWQQDNVAVLNLHYDGYSSGPLTRAFMGMTGLDPEKLVLALYRLGGEDKSAKNLRQGINIAHQVGVHSVMCAFEILLNGEMAALGKFVKEETTTEDFRAEMFRLRSVREVPEAKQVLEREYDPNDDGSKVPETNEQILRNRLKTANNEIRQIKENRQLERIKARKLRQETEQLKGEIRQLKAEIRRLKAENDLLRRQLHDYEEAQPQPVMAIQDN